MRNAAKAVRFGSSMKDSIFEELLTILLLLHRKLVFTMKGNCTLRRDLVISLVGEPFEGYWEPPAVYMAVESSSARAESETWFMIQHRESGSSPVHRFSMYYSINSR